MRIIFDRIGYFEIRVDGVINGENRSGPDSGEVERFGADSTEAIQQGGLRILEVVETGYKNENRAGLQCHRRSANVPTQY